MELTVVERKVPTALKKKLLASFLLALFIWPAVQHVLVVRYGVSPWWLFGMAMYCDIHRVQDFSVGQLVEGRVERLPEADGVVYSATRVGIDLRTARVVHEREVRIARRPAASR